MRQHSATASPVTGRRDLLGGIAGVLVLAWAAAAFCLAGADFVDRLTGPPRPLGVTAWNPGEYASARLERLFAAVEPLVPPGELVLVSAPAATAEEELFLSLWGAYHLPRHRVVRARHPGSPAGAYLVVLDDGSSAAGGERLLRHPAGALYRLPRDGV